MTPHKKYCLFLRNPHRTSARPIHNPKIPKKIPHRCNRSSAKIRRIFRGDLSSKTNYKNRFAFLPNLANWQKAPYSQKNISFLAFGAKIMYKYKTKGIPSALGTLKKLEFINSQYSKRYYIYSIPRKSLQGGVENM